MNTGMSKRGARNWHRGHAVTRHARAPRGSRVTQTSGPRQTKTGPKRKNPGGKEREEGKGAGRRRAAGKRASGQASEVGMRARGTRGAVAGAPWAVGGEQKRRVGLQRIPPASQKEKQIAGSRCATPQSRGHDAPRPPPRPPAAPHSTASLRNFTKRFAYASGFTAEMLAPYSAPRNDLKKCSRNFFVLYCCRMSMMPM
jgi:hypothetical protein